MNLTTEQQQAIFHDKGNVMVSASAGSGKTFVMIQRLIRLILEGKTDVSRVLAVTFTNLAATEMKDKLIRAITERINGGGLSLEDSVRLKEQLADVPSASICTFHSFCKDLIKNYFFELGLDASFTIADEVRAGLLKKRAIDGFFEDAYAGGDSRFKQTLSVFIKNRNDAFLKETVMGLQEFFSSEAYPKEFALNAISAYSEDGYKRIKDAFFAHYQGYFSKLKEALTDIAEEFSLIGLQKQVDAAYALAGFCSHFLAAEDFVQLVSFSHGVELRLPPLSPNGDEYLEGLKKRFSDLKSRTVDEAKYLREAFGGRTDEDMMAELIAIRPLAESLIELCFGYEDRYSAVKREENVVDFSDLEHFALKLLDDENIRKEVSERYEYIFADEYQDTNGVQEMILSRVERDNLFMVGDVKQSIYAFRGCKPEIFQSKFDRFTKGEGKAVSLTANFRSSGEVLSCVNKIFSAVMTVETAGLDYKSAPMRGGNGETGSARLFAVSKPEKVKSPTNLTKRGVYSVIERLEEKRAEMPDGEALAIAAAIREAVLTPIDLPDGSTKRVEYRDIVILMRSAGGFRELAGVLADNGIPVSYESKRSIAVFPETRMLISLLKLIDCMEQDVPLCAVMRSEIGGFADSELSSMRRYSASKAGGYDVRSFFEAVELYRESEDDELKQRLDEFFEYIERLRFLADFQGVGELLTRVVREKGLDLSYAACADGANKLKRINKLISEAYAAEGDTVRDFLDRIESDAGEITVTESDGNNAVRLMSIHASKGLEFPIVIVAGLDKCFNATDVYDEIIKDREYGIALKSYNLDKMIVGSNIFRELLKKRFRQACVKEEMRILYVALTRAKSRLYLTETVDSVPGYISAFDVLQADRYAKLISKRAVGVAEYSPEAIGDMCVEKAPRDIIASEKDEGIMKKIAEGLAFNYPHDVSVAAKRSVTAVLKEESEAPVPVIFNEYSDGKAAERGNAYHRYMELADFSKTTAAEISAAMQGFVESGLMTESEVGFIESDKIAALLNAEVFHLNGEYFRELPFEVLIPHSVLKDGGDSEEVLVQGVIDLIIFTPEGIRIVDYKVSGKDREALVREYAKQLELYAYAAERITGKRVISKTLVNLKRGELVEV